MLEWIAEYVPAAPVNVMAQFHPDNFCDPALTSTPRNMPSLHADQRIQYRAFAI
jgi:uncharacterized Fe-S radical SAM superfamily protein PflX